MMNEIVCYVLPFLCTTKKYNFLLCGLLCGPRIQIYGFWILEVHQPTEWGDSIITVCVFAKSEQRVKSIECVFFYTIN